MKCTALRAGDVYSHQSVYTITLGEHTVELTYNGIQQLRDLLTSVYTTVEYSEQTVEVMADVAV